MLTSEARIQANQRNAQLSTGPKTVEGKERSRANSYKHGLTGAGVVLPESDDIEVRRRFQDFAEETNAQGGVGMALARRAALSSVRMERAADQQTAALAQHIRKVTADFVPPEGLDEAEATRLRNEAIRAAMFDPSKEATLARKYEAAAERSFFRCLKELAKRDKQAKAELDVAPPPDSSFDPAFDAEMMGSFLQSPYAAKLNESQIDILFAEMGMSPPPRSPKAPISPSIPLGNDLPFVVGKRR